MANVPAYTQGFSTPKPAVKIFLYKIKRGTALWNFNHNFSQIPKMQGYVAMGGDPADIDVPSSVVRATLHGSKFNRLPFDSWIPRITTGQIDLATGLPPAGNLDTPEEKAYFALEDIDRTNMLLSWKNLYGGADTTAGTGSAYATNFAAFFANRKAALIDGINDILQRFKTDPKSAIDRYDLTTFLIKYSHGTELENPNNILNVDLASDPSAFFAAGTDTRLADATDFGRFSSGVVGNMDYGSNENKSSIPLVEENDIIELRVKYLDSNNSKWEVQESGFIDADGFQRVFMGYISSMTRTMQYNAQEQLKLVAAGVSKIFPLYDTTFVPSVTSSTADGKGTPGVNTFEAGIEMSDTRFSIWANNLNGKSTDQIFDNFMHSGLFCHTVADMQGEIPKLQEKLAAANKQLETITQAEITTNPVDNPVLSKAIVAQKVEIVGIKNDITNKEIAIEKAKRAKLDLVFDPQNINGGSNAATPPATLDIEYYLPISQQDTAATSFQIINYIPVLMSLARQYSVTDSVPGIENSEVKEAVHAAIKKVDSRVELLANVMATIEQSGYLGYKTMIQSGFKMFYPEMKRPDAIFSELKQNTFLELFEDRPGVIRLRPPKYNIINLNPDVCEYKRQAGASAPTVALAVPRPHVPVHLNLEYVIPASVIMDISVQRDDIGIITRADHTWETPLAGQPLEGYTGHFTDPGYLMKYGLRTTGPQHNPMSLSPKIAAVLSAVRIATANASARTITMTVFNNREYRLGRLYYIPTSIPSTAEMQPGNGSIVSKGIVGYLTKIDTALTYGQNAVHTLSLDHVRQADILEVQEGIYYANFKKLPDIATYMRLLATDQAVAQDAATAIHPKDSGYRDAVANDDTTVHDGYMIASNGIVSDAFDPATTRAVHQLYAAKLVGAGIAASIISPDDTKLQAEQNSFVTTISANGIQDDGAVSLTKNFLAKLTTYDVDPLKQVYPKVKAAPIQLYSTATADAYIPNTESTQNRDVDDLMQVVYNLLAMAIDAKYFGTGSDFNISKLDYQDIKVTDTGLAYIRVTGDKADDRTISDIRSNEDKSIQFKRTIFVGTIIDATAAPVTPAVYAGRVVFAFVQTEERSGKGAGNFNKFFVFHVPATKSLRLCNLINLGTPAGCGYRSLNTIAQAAQPGATGPALEAAKAAAQSDLHYKGQALVFTNLDVSLWSFGDILESCVELDIKDLPDQVPGATGDMQHLYTSYINCMVEPYNFAHDPQYNFCYNPAGVVGTPFSKDLASSIMKGCYDTCRSVLNTIFPAMRVAEVEGNEDLYYFKKEFGTATNIIEQVLVPVVQSYFSSGDKSGTGLFDNIAKQQQVFPQSTQPSLYTAVINKFDVSDLGSPTWKIGPALYPSGGTHCLLRSQVSFLPIERIDQFTISLPTAKVAIIPSNKYSLENFIKGVYAGGGGRIVYGKQTVNHYPFLCFHLADNLPFLNMATAVSPKKYYYNSLEGNALSAIWHTSYAQGASPFQSTKLLAERTNTDMLGKLNLLGLVD